MLSLSYSIQFSEWKRICPPHELVIAYCCNIASSIAWLYKFPPPSNLGLLSKLPSVPIALRMITISTLLVEENRKIIGAQLYVKLNSYICWWACHLEKSQLLSVFPWNYASMMSAHTDLTYIVLVLCTDWSWSWCLDGVSFIQAG